MTESPAPEQKTTLSTPVSAKPPASERSRNHEFLAAALEIVETPRSPITTRLTLFICFCFLSALIWSYFGWIDIHAVAQGTIRPSGSSKIVQPVEPGKVVSILVENGGHVNKGDVLLELDPTETRADRESLTRDLEASKAEVARRRVAIVAAHTADFRSPLVEFEPDTDPSVRRREEDVLAADLTLLASSKASLDAQLAEKLATKEKLTGSINARAKLIDLAKERIAIRETLKTTGFGSRALIIEASQQLETQMTVDAGDRGQLLESDAAIQSLERKIEETVAKFIADQSQKLSEEERKQNQLAKDLVSARSKNERTRLMAPIAGTIEQLMVTTLGQVVASGQSLLTIVPVDAPIEIEAMIANKDIGFVERGQPAVVKIEAFPFTHYNTVDGTVVTVSRDAVDKRDPQNPSGGANAAQRSPTENLAFPATISLAQRAIGINGKEVLLSPGMAVTVEIKIGQRRAIDYLLSPLREIASHAAHER
jgi:hemolysin D